MDNCGRIAAAWGAFVLAYDGATNAERASFRADHERALASFASKFGPAAGVQLADRDAAVKAAADRAAAGAAKRTSEDAVKIAADRAEERSKAARDAPGLVMR